MYKKLILLLLLTVFVGSLILPAWAAHAPPDAPDNRPVAQQVVGALC